MKKILIVDDQSDICRLIEVVLSGEGRSFVHAQNGEAGVDLARSEQPDLILMDLMMPGRLDGFQAIRAIRDDASIRQCPIIAMTARQFDAKDREKAESFGVQAWLCKPFVIRELRQVVEDLLR